MEELRRRRTIGLLAPSSLSLLDRVANERSPKSFSSPLDFAALGSHEAQCCLQGAPSTKNTTHRLLRPMATGLNVVSVTGSSAGCCFRRRRFCGRFLCCCCCEEGGGGDWFPSPPPPPEDEEARGAGAPAPDAALPSSFFSPLPLLSSGVAAATRSRERRDDRGRATGATIRATCDADAAPGRAADAAAERGARACCIAACSLRSKFSSERERRRRGRLALAASLYSLSDLFFFQNRKKVLSFESRKLVFFCLLRGRKSSDVSLTFPLL